MNSTIIQGSWTEIKGKIKTQWAKFNDDDLEAMKGNLDQLTGKIQKVYGYGKEQAEREYNDFKKTLVTTIDAATTMVSEKTDALIAGATHKSEPKIEATTATQPEETKIKH